MHFLLFSTLAYFVCLFTTVLTAADQVYCMCCADRRECEQDPTCCTDGCCRMRPWCITHQTCYPLYIRPGGHACCCRRRRFVLRLKSGRRWTLLICFSRSLVRIKFGRRFELFCFWKKRESGSCQVWLSVELHVLCLKIRRVWFVPYNNKYCFV